MLADWLSQVLAGAKALEFDLSRVLRNGSIGAFFGPIVCAYYGFSDIIRALACWLWANGLQPGAECPARGRQRPPGK
eukprot:scaffold25722_cov109-Isochrysis_galbana.AAC.14